MSILISHGFGNSLTSLTTQTINSTIDRMAMQFNQDISESLLEANLISLGGISSSAVSLHALLGANMQRGTMETSITPQEDGGVIIEERFHYDHAIDRINNGLDNRIGLDAKQSANDIQALLQDTGNLISTEMPAFANQIPLQTLSLLEMTSPADLDVSFV